MTIPGIDAVVVINLDRETERLREFDQMMKVAKISYQRFSAVSLTDKKDFPEALAGRIIPHNLKLGEIGCMASHLAVWQQALDNNWNRVIIFEDDARTLCANDIRPQLERFYSQGLLEPDLLYLGKCLCKCATMEPLSEMVYKVNSLMCAHAYVITRKAIEKIFSQLPFRRALDFQLDRMLRKGQLIAYAYHPSLFYQKLGPGKKLNSFFTSQECSEPLYYSSYLSMLITICLVLGVILIILWLIALFYLLKWSFPNWSWSWSAKTSNLNVSFN